jgi:hypothetical protein
MVSPTRNELLASLVTLINTATGLSKDVIIRGKQNAPVPLGDNYCTLLYVTDIANGTSNITIEDTPDPNLYTYAMRGKRYYTFSIQFYRTGATDLAKLLMMFNETPTGLEFFQTVPYTFRRIAQVGENAQVISANYEERAALNLELTVAETQRIIVNKVSGTTINLTYDNSGVPITRIIDAS